MWNSEKVQLLLLLLPKLINTTSQKWECKRKFKNQSAANELNKQLRKQDKVLGHKHQFRALEYLNYLVSDKH